MGVGVYIWVPVFKLGKLLCGVWGFGVGGELCVCRVLSLGFGSIGCMGFAGFWVWGLASMRFMVLRAWSVNFLGS